MLTEWYVMIMGDERGPVTIDELRSLAASGQLAVDDLVRSDDDLAWIRADCIAEISDHLSAGAANEASARNDNQSTGEMPADNSDWCSLELQSTDTKASIRWTTPGTGTVASATATRAQHAIVRVPHRTLKVGHGATPAGRAEKRAHQTTVANRFDAETDTVVSQVLPGVPELSSGQSSEHRA